MSAPQLAAESADKILATAGPTLTLPDYARIIGISRDTAYRRARRDDLGVRVLRIGRRMVIPTADVRRQLGLEGA